MASKETYITAILDQEKEVLHYQMAIAMPGTETITYEKNYFCLKPGWIFPRHYMGFNNLQIIRDQTRGLEVNGQLGSLMWVEGDKEAGFRLMTTVVNNGKPCAIEQSLPKQRFVIIAEALDMPLLSKLIHSVKTLAKVKEVAYRHNYFVTQGWYEYHLSDIAAKDALGVRKAVIKGLTHQETE